MNKSTHRSSPTYHEQLDLTDTLLERYFPLETYAEELAIQVGPITMKAHMEEGFLEMLNPRYEGFLAGADARFDFRAEATHSEDLDLSGYPNILVRSRPGGHVHYVFRWDFIAKIDLQKCYACILIAPIGSPLCLDSIFRIATAFMAVQKGGFLLHSAAVTTPGGAYVFCGMSGSGKSTLAKVSAGHHDVLTDEMTLIEKRGDTYQVWGTPFWGEMQLSVNRCAPLKSVFVLKKAGRNSVGKLPMAEGITRFMQTILYFAQNVELSTLLLDHTLEFLETVPYYELSFLPESSLWEVIDV